MKKRDYFLYAINGGLYLRRDWLISVFGILDHNTPEKDLETIGFYIKDGQMRAKVSTDKHPGGIEIIDDYVKGEPLYGRHEHLQLVPEEMRCVRKVIDTTYGLLVINSLLIEYPYGGLIEYVNHEITPKLINTIAYEALSKNIITVDQHIKFENAISMVTALATVGVPSASERSVTPNPNMKKEKDKLLKEYEGRLHDPAAVAELQEKISAIDKDYLKGDSSEGFFISNKLLHSRMRTLGIYGAEPDFYDESKINVMTKSLDEGWGVKELPMMTNASRGGSYDRGASTALGGAEVKISSRIFQNYKVSPIACDTSHGIPVIINDDNYRNFEGRYLLGHDKPLTNDEVKKHIGKVIEIRSPTYCKSPGTEICFKCMGDAISNSNMGITILMTEILSTFLLIFLKKIHSSALSVTKYSYLNRIT